MTTPGTCISVCPGDVVRVRESRADREIRGVKERGECHQRDFKTQLWHRRVHQGRFPSCLRFIVQFIRTATWNVGAYPVTAQQKAKLRGAGGCRTGRLTGWLTLFWRRIASRQSWSCHLDRNPFFGCNPHHQPFCHSRPHTHTSSFFSIPPRKPISHLL